MHRVCLLVSLVLALGVWFCSPAEAAKKMTLTVMPLGDSITAGYPGGLGNPPASEWVGYRGRLATLLADDGYTINFVGSQNGTDGTFDGDHEGHSGYIISQITEFAPGWIASAGPDVILLLIGTNDMYPDGTYVNETSAGAPARLTTLLQTIQTAAPAAYTIVSSIPVVQAVAPFDAAWTTRCQAYNAAVPGVVLARRAAGQKVLFVDNANVTMGADGAHPMYPSGYRQIAETWLPQIRASQQRIVVTTSQPGGGGLTVTITASDPTNTISAVRLGTGYGVKFASTPVINGSTASFTLQRNTSSAAVHLPFTVVDRFGEWVTFVGGGPGSF